MSGWQPVYRVVRRIPPGRVATYGQVAAMAGMPRAARQVGWALAALGVEDDVPWHRVINAQGRISPRATREVVDLQRAMLESEGVDFGSGGRVDLARYAWQPGRRGVRAAQKKSAAEGNGSGCEGAAEPKSRSRDRKSATKRAKKTRRQR